MEKRVVSITGCARCDGEGHEDLVFRLLTHPLALGGHVLEWWAPCPVNGEPILMEVKEDAE